MPSHYGVIVLMNATFNDMYAARLILKLDHDNTTIDCKSYEGHFLPLYSVDCI